MARGNKKRRVQAAKIDAQGNIVASDVEARLQAAQADIAGETIAQVAATPVQLQRLLAVLAEDAGLLGTSQSIPSGNIVFVSRMSGVWIVVGANCDDVEG